jgi:hypothetical protein
MPASPEASFGDNVRVRSTPETEALGVAGRIGQVWGQTTPSVTGVALVGRSDSDCAITVHFEGRADILWFAPELLEFVDHAPGTEIRIGGASFTRDAGGNWMEAPRKRVD